MSEKTIGTVKCDLANFAQMLQVGFLWGVEPLCRAIETVFEGNLETGIPLKKGPNSHERDSQKLFCDATRSAMEACDANSRNTIHRKVSDATTPCGFGAKFNADTSPWYSRGLVQLVQNYRQLLNLCTTLL